MMIFELTPANRRQEFVFKASKGAEPNRLTGSFQLPKGQRALIGIMKDVVSNCPVGFTESSRGFYFVYLHGKGELEQIELPIQIAGEPVRDLPMFVRLWEGEGAVSLVLDNTANPSQVAIIGGCCTRDTFELTSTVSVSEYRARTNVAGLASPSLASLPEKSLERIPSAFQRRMVKGDLLKESLRLVILADGDHVIIDFMIEKRGVFFVGETVVTRSEEFSKLGLEANDLPGKVTDIEEGSEIYFALFRRGWKYAVEQLTAAGKTVIVNEIKWASSNEKGEVFLLRRF